MSISFLKEGFLRYKKKITTHRIVKDYGTVSHNLKSVLSDKSHSYECVNYPFRKIELHEGFPELLADLGYENYLDCIKAFRRITIVGDNWLESDRTKRKPIAIMLGFNVWKYGFMSDYFSDYRLLFMRRRFAITSLFSILKILKNIIKEEPKYFIVWGKNHTYIINTIQRFFKIPSLYVEDGFLRSMGIGNLHTTPLSLCFDKKSIYFDAQNETEIEDILNNYDFDKSPNLMKKANASISLFKLAQLTKYYSPSFEKQSSQFRVSSRYAILVVGQVEDDASITYGMQKRMTNNELVQFVRNKHPNADIYYRPHPDVLYNNRKSYSDPKKIQDICIVLDTEVDLHTAITQVDHVYTMTSLVGMEALILNKKVTTLGVPFYAGWGLTEALYDIPRRKRSLTIDQLFAGVYLLYSKYFHPVDSQEISFTELASYFFVQSLLKYDIFSIQEIIPEFDNISESIEYYSVALKLYYYLQQTQIHGSADVKTVMGIIDSNFQIRDFEQISQLLIMSSNYEALVVYCNAAINYINSCNVSLEKNINIRLYERFFYALSIAYKNTGGRVIKPLCNLNRTLLESYDSNHTVFNSLIKSYLRCLSCGLHYDIIEDLINQLLQKNPPGHVLQKLLSEMSKKPTRSERDHAKRNRILEILAKNYLQEINKQYSGQYDFFINKCLYYIALRQKNDVLSSYKSHLALFKNDSFSFANPEFPYWGNLNKRIGHFQQIFSFILKYGDRTFIENILDDFHAENYMNEFHDMQLAFYKEFKEYDLFLGYYNSLSSQKRNSPKNLSNYIYVLKCIGQTEQALRLSQNYNQHKMTLEKLISVKNTTDRLSFSLETSNILKSYPQPKVPKGVIFIASQNCFNSLAMMTPVYLELKKKGYAVINLKEGLLPQDKTNIPYIDRFANIIPNDTHLNEFKNEWYINWDKKKVIADDIDFYQGFYENLSCYIRSFFVDINIPVIHDHFMNILPRADVILSVCQDIFSNLTLKYNMPTVFVGSNTHVAPYSIMRDFCRAKDHSLLSFIHANLAYENYFSNLGGKFANTMAVTDMTLYPNIRAPFLARKDQFDPWYEKNKNNQEYLDKAKSIITVNRNNSLNNSDALSLIEFLKEQKKQGKKILCAFGKITVDLCVPYDGGNAHEDMADWLNHTVKSCGESDNVILLVKPHPHELRPEIALDVQEYFPDIIHEEIKPNVRVLGHKEINVHELAPFIDLAIMWNGSSGLELTAQGIPVIMCAYFGKHDYPVDLIYPENRAQYASYLKSGKYSKPDPETQKRAAFLISYLGTDEITLINQYSRRPVTNDKIGVPRWHYDKLDKYLEHGDHFIETAANRIIEKVEKARNNF